MRRTLYCHLWCLRLYNIFPHYLKTARFSVNLTEHKGFVRFRIQILSETFLLLSRIQLGTIMHLHNFCVKHPLFLTGFNETWIFSTDFVNSSSTKFRENPYSGAELNHADGQTDRHDEAIVIVVRGDLRSLRTTSLDTTHPSTIFYRLFINGASLRRH
jgi:hypothetical protein